MAGETKLEALFNAKAVIIATGTFLGGRVYIGDVSYESGPDGMFPATELSKALKNLIFRFAGLKPALRHELTESRLILLILKSRTVTKKPYLLALKQRKHLKIKCAAT